jgi:hypothetical protein
MMRNISEYFGEIKNILKTNSIKHLIWEDYKRIQDFSGKYKGGKQTLEFPCIPKMNSK